MTSLKDPNTAPKKPPTSSKTSSSQKQKEQASDTVLLFPVILLEGALRKIKSLTTYLKPLKTVDHVHTKCLSITYLPEDALQEALAGNIT